MFNLDVLFIIYFYYCICILMCIMFLTQSVFLEDQRWKFVYMQCNDAPSTCPIVRL